MKRNAKKNTLNVSILATNQKIKVKGLIVQKNGVVRIKN